MSKKLMALYRCLICQFETKRRGVRETVCPYCHKPMAYITTTEDDD